MGARTDAAERAVEEQRRVVEQRVASLGWRVRDDAAQVRARTRERASNLSDGAVPGTEALSRQVQAYPTASVLVAAGLGVALGMVTDAGMGRPSRVSPAEERERRLVRERLERGREQESESGGGASSGVFAALVAQGLQSVIGPLQEQVQQVLREVLSGPAPREREEPAPPPEGQEAARRAA